MKTYTIDRSVLKFKYLPEFAGYLLQNKLEEFVTVGIRFAREMDLPMLKPLARLPEGELVKLSLESNKTILKSLAEGTIGDFIEANLRNWVNNTLGIIDRKEIEAEDLVIAYFIRRKLFSHFLYGYTQNAVIQQLIINEVDVYTTQEELLSLKVYMDLQREQV